MAPSFAALPSHEHLHGRVTGRALAHPPEDTHRLEPVDPYIEPEFDVVDVPEVKIEFLHPRQGVSAASLGPTR